MRGNNHEIRHKSYHCFLHWLVYIIGDCGCRWTCAKLGVNMKDYKELVERLRINAKWAEGHEWEIPRDLVAAADAIENLMADVECRKTIAAGLVYLNNELAKACAEKAEQIYQLQAEIRQLNSENFWLCRGN